MSLSDSFKQLETKQKVMLIVTIVAFIYVIYMGYDTFFANSSESVPEPTPTPEVIEGSTTPDTTVVETSAKPVEQIKVAEVSPNEKITVTQSPTQKTDEMVLVKAAPTPEQIALLAEAQEMQREYLRLVNQFQIAQLQERLEQANASIAASKLKSAITASEVQKLNDELKQRQQAANRSDLIPESGSNASSNAGLNNVALQKVQATSSFQLMYVGKQKGTWVAMLKDNDSVYEVKVGTRLPDGFTVISIDTRGVVLTNEGMKRYITMPRSLD